MQKSLKWLAIFTTVWMFLVLLGGALVTKADAGQGCGDEWPLCNGKFVPAYTIESMIEYSHRAVSAIVGLLVLVLFIWVIVKHRDRKDIVLYAAVTLFFTVLQGALGAMAVVWGQSSAVMALHFGFSLTAFASCLLLAIAIARIGLEAHESGWGEARLLNGPSVSGRFRLLVWLTTIYSYIVVYTGAYMRHTESWAGCRDWPLCEGQVIPELSGATGVAFMHRVASLLLFILVVYMLVVGVRQYKHIKEIRTSCYWTFALIVAQIFSGALVVFSLSSTDGFMYAALLHTVIVAGLFGVLCYLSIVVWQLRGASMDPSAQAEVTGHAER